MVWISLRAALLALVGATCLCLLVPSSLGDEGDKPAAPRPVRRKASPPRRVRKIVILEHALAENVGLLVRSHVGGDARPGLRVEVDFRTNKLFLSGRADEVDSAVKMIEHLDVPIYCIPNRVHVVSIKHRDCRAMAALLQPLAGGSSVFGWPRTVRRPPSPPSARYQAPWERDESPVIVCDVVSNSLLIAGTDYQFAQLSQVIEALDLDPAVWKKEMAKTGGR